MNCEPWPGCSAVLTFKSRDCRLARKFQTPGMSLLCNPRENKVHSTVLKEGSETKPAGQ